MKNQKTKPENKREGFFAAGAACLAAALGLWHFLDVRAGVLETGDSWLYGWYVLLLAAVLVILAVLGLGLLSGNLYTKRTGSS